MITLITPLGHEYTLTIAQIGGQADKSSQLGGNVVFSVLPPPLPDNLNDFYKGIVNATNNDGFGGVLVGDEQFVFQGYLLQFNAGDSKTETLLSVDYKTYVMIKDVKDANS